MYRKLIKSHTRERYEQTIALAKAVKRFFLCFITIDIEIGILLSLLLRLQCRRILSLMTMLSRQIYPQGSSVQIDEGQNVIVTCRSSAWRFSELLDVAVVVVLTVV